MIPVDEGIRLGHTSEQLDRSLLRVYGRLACADSYASVVDALRSEMLIMLGYSSVWLQLVRPETHDILMLESGGPVEVSVRAMIRSDPRFRETVHGEDFLVFPYDGDPFLNEVMRSRDIYVVPDARTHPLTNKDIVAVTGNRTMVCMPLVLADKTIGCLSTGTFFDEGVRVPDAGQLDYLRRLANHVAVALDRVRFSGERREAIEALRGMVEELEFRSHLLDSVVDGVVVRDASDLRVLYVNEAMCGLVGRTSADLVGQTDTGWTPPDEREAVGWHFDRVRRLGSGTTETYIETGDRTRTAVEVTTSIVTYHAREVFMSVVRDISERRAAQASMEHMALHDTLTGLANRALINDRLELAIAHTRRTRTRLAVYFLDLDHFKTVNDTAGHGIGDLLLAGVAARLEAAVRSDDTVGRLGGDEFMLVLTDVGTDEEACAVGEKLIDGLREPFSAGGQDFSITASIGIATYDGGDLPADELLRQADMAMYSAKESGRNSWRLYDPTLSESALERYALRGDLKHAIERGELAVHYQPIVELGTGRIVGAEALCRWTHPVRGAIPPATFIPMSEECGFVCELGAWVIAEACAEARHWQALASPGVRLSVNLSPSQLCDPELVQTVTAALAESGLDPRLLEMEITESIALRESAVLVESLTTLRHVGSTVAIDDFGTGYASLDYLKRFPVDTIKIDRSFVKDLQEPGGLAIAPAIVSLARSLELGVVAEGVETDEQLQALIAAGCPRAQGFLFGPAVPADEFRALLGTRLAVPRA